MKTIKKIVALTTGALMVGTTLFGAMAADLKDYPLPMFSDGVTLVVGNKESAATDDVVGATDVAASLAKGVVSTSTSTGSVVTVSSGEATKIETGSDKLNVNETLVNVKSTALDNEDLPTLLADGVFKTKSGNEYKYTQKIEFGSNVVFTHYADSDYKNREPNLMIFNDRQKNFTTYTLTFSKSAEGTVSGSTITDFEDRQLKMLAKTYDITTASNLSGNKIKFVLMGGAIKDTLEQGAVKKYTLDNKEYEVEITYIGTVSSTSKVKFKVNGEATDALLESQTAKLSDGVTIGVREILEEEAGEVSADMVEFYLGAEKLTCEDTDLATYGIVDNLEMSDEDIDDVYCNIAISTTGTKMIIDKLNFIWRPDTKLFVTEAQSQTIPGLESYKVSYKGLTTETTETIQVKNNGDTEIEVSMPLKGGTVVIPLVADKSGKKTNFTIIGGADDGERLIGALANAELFFDKDTDKYFVASDTNAKESHLMELVKASNTDGCKFKDVASGTTYDDKKNGTSFSVGDVSLTVGRCSGDENNVSVRAATNGVFDRLYTKEGLTLWMPLYNSTGCTQGTNDKQGGKCFHTNTSGAGYSANSTITYVVAFEESDKNRVLGGGRDINISVGWTSSKAEVKNLDDSKGYLGYSGNYHEIGDTDKFEGYVSAADDTVGTVGTKILYDTNPTQDTVTIEYYGDEAYGNVYVSDTETSWSTSTSGSDTVTQRVNVGYTLLANDALAADADLNTKNYILVGGPCANEATAKVTGQGFRVFEGDNSCLTGFESGKARIKAYTQGTKVALVVAGMDAEDTTRATRVLANYKDYSLTGDEVTVIGTGKDFTNIKVEKVTTT